MYDNNNVPFDPSEIFEKVQAQLCRNDFCTSAVPAQIQGTKDQVILAIVTSSSNDESFSSVNSESALFVFSQSVSVAKKLFLINVVPLIPESVVDSSTTYIKIRLPKNVMNEEEEGEEEDEEGTEGEDEDEDEEKKEKKNDEKKEEEEEEEDKKDEDEKDNDDDDEKDKGPDDDNDDENGTEKEKDDDDDEEEEEKEEEKEKKEEGENKNVKNDDNTIVYESTIINTYTETFFSKVVVKKTETAPEKSAKPFRWLKKYKPSKLFIILYYIIIIIL